MAMIGCPTSAKGGHLISADRFLRSLVSKILASAAYQRDGMLIITFDEADIHVKGGKVVVEQTDSTACCYEPVGPNTVAPGQTGPGGGRTGTLIISKYVAAMTFLTITTRSCAASKISSDSTISDSPHRRG
jgi:phosphatidylinositol-3-phosphatase